MAGAYEISCPDPACEKDGVFQLHEIEQLVSKDLVEKHKAFRLNTEVALDSNRTWCPKPGCNTICHICASSTTLSNTVSSNLFVYVYNEFSTIGTSIIINSQYQQFKKVPIPLLYWNSSLELSSKNPGITRNS